MQIYLFFLCFVVGQIFFDLFVRKRNVCIRISRKITWNTEIKYGLRLAFVIIDFFVLFCLAVFRDVSVGADYVNYVNIFEAFLKVDFDNISDNHYMSKGEYSFVLLGAILKNIFSDYLGFVCVAYFLILFLVYRFIKKYSKDILLSGFLFFSFSFYNMSLNIMRQYIAAAIVLKAIEYIENKPVKFFLCVAIAMTFHKTAILFILLYPVLKYIKDIRVSCICLLFICAIIDLFSNDFVQWFADMENYGSKYTTASSEAELDLKIFMNCILFFLFFCFSKQFCREDVNANKWIAMAAITLGLNFSAIYFHYINRVFLYFMLPEIVSIVNFISSFNSNNVRLALKMMIILLFSVYYIVLVSKTNCYETVPYSSVYLGL